VSESPLAPSVVAAPSKATATGPWLFLAALALGVALVAGTVITARTIAYVKTFNTSLMTVTGQAVQDLTSNEVKWIAGFSLNATQAHLAAGYAAMAGERAAVLAFLGAHGVPSADVTFSPVSANMNYVDCKVAPQGCGPFGPDTYTLQQTVTVQSADVRGISALAQNVQPLLQQPGVFFSTQALKYYYTRLSDLRGRLEAAATADAQRHAQEIAAATGARVGGLVSVTTEPLQLTPINSTEVSNSGIYDTTTIHKKLTAIVEASFRLLPGPGSRRA
jgi:hypothetical protein